MSVFACIFARGGSKGVPGKNLACVAGVPLIGHAVRCALAAQTVDRVFVSTDDPATAEAARAHGAEVPFMRPDALASDTAKELNAWQHFVQHQFDLGATFDVMVSVPCTAPLRIPDDVDQAVSALLAREEADIVITVTEAHRNPYFNQVQLDPTGRARVVLEGAYTRRQDVPLVQDITTVAYAARPAYVLQATHVLEGCVQTVTVPKVRSLDIDTPLDLLLAEFLYGRPEVIG